MVVGVGGAAERVLAHKLAAQRQHVKVGALAHEWTSVGLALLTEHTRVEDVTEAVVADGASRQTAAVERNAADQVLDDGLAVARDARLLDGEGSERDGMDRHGHGLRVGWRGHGNGRRSGRVQRGQLDQRLRLAVDWLGWLMLDWLGEGMRLRRGWLSVRVAVVNAPDQRAQLLWLLLLGWLLLLLLRWLRWLLLLLSVCALGHNWLPLLGLLIVLPVLWLIRLLLLLLLLGERTSEHTQHE